MDILDFYFTQMPIWANALFFIAGLILIIKGGDIFVDSASWIAEVLGVPKFVIGATIVSIATTLPEILVSVAATMKGNIEMAAGNAIGSVTANTALILGIFALFMPFSVKSRDFTPKALMMTAACITLYIGCVFTKKFQYEFVAGETNQYYTLSNYAILALFIIFAVFLTENILSVRKSNSLTSNNHIEKNEERISASASQWIKHIILFVLGACGIIAGAELLVNSGQILAKELGIPQRIISVIFIAIGTSLPELTTAITAIRKKEGALSVGNILGANIIDLTLILPICSAVSMSKGSGALAVSVSSVNTDTLFCLFAISAAVIPAVITQKFHRWQGAVMLASYGIYAVLTFLV